MDGGPLTLFPAFFYLIFLSLFPFLSSSAELKKKERGENVKERLARFICDAL